MACTKDHSGNLPKVKIEGLQGPAARPLEAQVHSLRLPEGATGCWLCRSEPAEMSLRSAGRSRSTEGRDEEGWRSAIAERSAP